MQGDVVTEEDLKVYMSLKDHLVEIIKFNNPNLIQWFETI
jgi:hypothetical protein